jgi:REP element-mobilizing transposase RayT
MKQKSFFETTSKSEKQYFSSRETHGGPQKGRKLKRPLIEGKWTHLTLKSDKAKGEFSFLKVKNNQFINKTLKEKAKKFGVIIGDYVNMGDHLHIKVKFSKRELFQKFLISITGLIARFITKARKGFKFGKFWSGLAYTRILTSAFEVTQLKGYFEANHIQREKGYTQRKLYLKSYNSWIQSLKGRSKIGKVTKCW